MNHTACFVGPNVVVNERDRSMSQPFFSTSACQFLKLIGVEMLPIKMCPCGISS